jgi:hypothetical protein
MLTQERRDAEAETLRLVMAKLEEALRLSLELEREETPPHG